MYLYLHRIAKHCSFLRVLPHYQSRLCRLASHRRLLKELPTQSTGNIVYCGPAKGCTEANALLATITSVSFLVPLQLVQ